MKRTLAAPSRSAGRGHRPRRRPHRLQHRVHQRRPAPPPSRRRRPRPTPTRSPSPSSTRSARRRSSRSRRASRPSAGPTTTTRSRWASCRSAPPRSPGAATRPARPSGSTRPIEEAGAEAPVRYDDADGAPIDEVAELAPDLILATNSGITEAEYAKLSKIAPVVAYPEAPWTTDWKTSLEMVGEALGRTALADEVEADTEADDRGGQGGQPRAPGRRADLRLPRRDRPVHRRHVRPRGPARLDPARLRDGRRTGGGRRDQARRVLRHGLRGEVRRPRLRRLPDLGGLRRTASRPSPATSCSARSRRSPTATGTPRPTRPTPMASTNPTPLSIPVIVSDFLPHVVEALEGA